MTFQDRVDTVLLIDDEPFQTEWLTDYFKARGFAVAHSEDLQSALAALEKVRYRYVIIDLSIPFSPTLAQPLATLGSEFYRYPGLMAARRARTTGHNTFQIIVYSVHDSEEVQEYADRIVCRYILKGRPRELKLHIESTINRRPHGWRSMMGPKAPKVKKVSPTRRSQKKPSATSKVASKRKRPSLKAQVFPKQRPSYRPRQKRLRIRG
jgi:CheY-like chemotaxis protein